MRVLVTGGAGFIGSHLYDYLTSLPEVEEVVLFDRLEPQAHPQSDASTPKFPSWLPEKTWRTVRVRHQAPGMAPEWRDLEVTSLWYGDVCAANSFGEALQVIQPDVVIHLAALVGVAQSALQPRRYALNSLGTACVVDRIAAHNDGNRQLMQVDAAAQRVVELAEARLEVEKLEAEASRLVDEGSDEAAPALAVSARAREQLIDLEQVCAQLDAVRVVKHVFIASSMLVYGDGRDADGNPVLASHESDSVGPASVYALTKLQGEEMALLIGRHRNLDITVGRLFNVYGPRQNGANPHTGIVAGFTSTFLAGGKVPLFGNGTAVRDFVFVRDAVKAIWTITTKGGVPEGYPYFAPVYNIATGHGFSVRTVAQHLIDLCGGGEVELLPFTRVGDVERCVGNNDRLIALGWTPETTLEQGLAESVAWAKEQVGLLTPDFYGVAADLGAHCLLREEVSGD